MGLDVYVNLVAAVPMKRFANVVNVPEQVKKFDPDNGKPYMKSVDKYFLQVGPKISVPAKSDDLLSELANYLESEPTELEIFQTSPDDARDEAYVGLRIGPEGKSHRNGDPRVVVGNVQVVQDAVIELSGELKKYGCKLEPTIVVIPYFSY